MKTSEHTWHEISVVTSVDLCTRCQPHGTRWPLDGHSHGPCCHETKDASSCEGVEISQPGELSFISVRSKPTSQVFKSFLWLFRISCESSASWTSLSVINDKPLRAEAMCYLLCRGIYRYQHLEQKTFRQIWPKFQLIDWFRRIWIKKNTTLDFSEQRSLDNGLLWKSWWTIRPPVRQIWTPTLTDSSPVSASNESNAWLNDVESVPKAKSS